MSPRAPGKLVVLCDDITPEGQLVYVRCVDDSSHKENRFSGSTIEWERAKDSLPSHVNGVLSLRAEVGATHWGGANNYGTISANAYDLYADESK